MSFLRFGSASFRSQVRNSVKMPLKARLTTSEGTAKMLAFEEDPSDVLFYNNGVVRTIELNRPQKLNSLNYSMAAKMLPRLVEYTKSDIAKIIVLKGKGEKSLCAGGDVAALCKLIQQGPEGSRMSAEYFHKEYSLDLLIATYPKPYISLMDGITMGGGCGLSIHAPFRVATERTITAMPEMAIGFFPDVGATFFLPRLDGKLGYYLALTGQTLKGLDALIAGFATHYVPSERLADLEAKLGTLNASFSAELDEYYSIVNDTLNEYSEAIPEDYEFCISDKQRAIIDKAFSQKTVEGIIAALEETTEEREFIEATVKALKERSPLSLKVSLAMLHRAEALDITDALQRELEAAEQFMYKSDFAEGVSAKLLTKPSRAPKWNPPTLEEVTNETVQNYLKPMPNSSVPPLEIFSTKSYEEYPYNFGLPTEKEVRAYITGEDRSNRRYLPTKDEVVKEFANRTKNKNGAKWKVDNILKRKCAPSEYEPSYIDWVD